LIHQNYKRKILFIKIFPIHRFLTFMFVLPFHFYFIMADRNRNHVSLFLLVYIIKNYFSNHPELRRTSALNPTTKDIQHRNSVEFCFYFLLSLLIFFFISVNATNPPNRRNIPVEMLSFVSIKSTPYLCIRYFILNKCLWVYLLFLSGFLF